MIQLRTSHLEVVKRIIHHFKGCLGRGLHIMHATQPLVLIAHSNADWVRCPDSRRFTTSYFIFLGPSLILWCAKKQPTVSWSSVEAEYWPLDYTCADTVWIQNLLRELGFPLTSPTLLLCDNLSATYTAANPIFHARTKHIEFDYHFT